MSNETETTTEQASLLDIDTTPATTQSSDAQYDSDFEGVVIEDGEPAPAKPANDDNSDLIDIDDDPVDGDEPAAEEVDDPAEPEPKPASTQQRIDELTARLRESERKVAEMERGSKQTEEPEGSDETSEAGPPDPEDYEFGEADSKFIADLARFSADQQFNERQQRAQVEAEVEALETGWREAIGKPEIAEKYPDFNDKVTEGANRGEWECSVPMAVLIKNSEVGPHVAYELATNAAEARRIAGLSTQEQLLEMGRLEGRISARLEASTSSNAAPKKKAATKAPPPPTARSRGSGGTFAKPEDALYEKMLREFT